MRGLLAPPGWGAHYLVAFAVVIALRVIKGVPLWGVANIWWTAVSAALLSVLTGAGGLIPGVLFRRRPKIVFICRSASMGLLLLVSALMLI